MNGLKDYLNDEMLATWHELISHADNVVLLAHVSPDGDAIGSTMSMAFYLEHLGKTPHVVVPNLPPDFLTWVPGMNKLVVDECHPHAAEQLLKNTDLVFLMDCNDTSRLDNLSKKVCAVGKPTIVIDHHLNPKREGYQLLISDPEASSTCEIVFSLLWQLGVWEEMNRECAEAIYCGMMTDTGAFTYNSNRPEVFFIISQLLRKNIDKDAIYRNVYYTFTIDKLRLQGYTLYNNTHFYEDGKAAVYTLSREELTRFNFKRGDAEGLVNMPLQVKETVLSISLREDLEQDIIRVSLRSTGNIPCNLISEKFFNGGGHANASGGTLKGMTCAEALEIAKNSIAYFRDYLNPPIPPENGK